MLQTQQYPQEYQRKQPVQAYTTYSPTSRPQAHMPINKSYYNVIKPFNNEKQHKQSVIF